MKKILTTLLLTISVGLYAQTTLNKLGQTPGGASYHVNWDSIGQKLIVGCGTSIWIYDFTNPQQPQIIAKRPFTGLVNETSLFDNTLFVAATHDGVYALDYNSPNLDILNHYNMKNMGDSSAQDMWRSNDTLYIADNKMVRVLDYGHGTGFMKIATFGGPASYCVARRGNYIAVGNKGTLTSDGNISVFNIQNLTTPVAVWSSPWLNVVQNIGFADLNDSIIYVCGGPEDLLFTKSNFFALQFNGSTLTPLDTFSVSGGILGIAQMNIINYDSRNDTLFICTTAAYDTFSFPLAYMPIVDATGLPSDTMEKIGHVFPGLWHFDAALMHGTPFIAMSSEWCGVLVSDVSQLIPYDTLGLYETGGWCVNAKVKDNILWACHEGYGLVAYETDSLLYTAGFIANGIRMHIYDLNNHYFSSDLEFLNDTLLMINSSEVYNIKPWQQGGQPVLAYDMNKNWMNFMSNVHTNIGQRMVATFDNLLGKKWISLFNPLNTGGSFANMLVDTTNSNPRGLYVSCDTVYYGKKIGNDHYLFAKKVVNDNFLHLDSIKLTMTLGALSSCEIMGISVENGIIAVGYGAQFALFRWNGNALQEMFVDFKFTQRIMDIVLRNNLVYVADRFYGFKVYDVSSHTNAVLVAEGKGTGGWTTVFGSTAITVGDDGVIYLCDFHAGVIMYEAYDTTMVSTPFTQPYSNNQVQVYPNPAKDFLTIAFENPVNESFTLDIYNIQGAVVSRQQNIRGNQVTVYRNDLSKGMYIFRLSNEGTSYFGKFVVE